MTCRSSFEVAFAVATTLALCACDKTKTTSPAPASSPDLSVAASAPRPPGSASAGSTPEPDGASPSALDPPKLRDAEREIATIAPFDEAGPAEAKQRVAAALAVCGDFREPAVWGRDGDGSGAAPSGELVSLCAPATAAKLLVLSASLEANDDAEGAKRSVKLALALDPNLELPPAAPAPLRTAFAEAKKRKPGTVRLGAITTTATTGQKSLEDSLARLVPQFRACYTLGLLDNPNLQGRVSILAVLGEAGRVQSATASGDIPDGRVVKCATNVIRRAVLAPPDRAPARIAVPLLASP